MVTAVALLPAMFQHLSLATCLLVVVGHRYSMGRSEVVSRSVGRPCAKCRHTRGPVLGRVVRSTNVALGGKCSFSTHVLPVRHPWRRRQFPASHQRPIAMAILAQAACYLTVPP